MAKFAYTKAKQTMYTTAAGAIAASGTWGTASDLIANVQDTEYAHLTLTANGTNSAAAGDVTFYFITICDGGDTWPTESGNNKTVTLTGTTAAVANHTIDCRAASELKVLKIVNGDASHQATACNAYISFKD